MRGPRIAAALVVALVAGVVSRLRSHDWRWSADRPPKAVVAHLHDSTSVDGGTGAVRSVQTADLLLEEQALRRIGSDGLPPLPFEEEAQRFQHVGLIVADEYAVRFQFSIHR